jgi:hypothetical protein
MSVCNCEQVLSDIESVRSILQRFDCRRDILRPPEFCRDNVEAEYAASRFKLTQFEDD